MVCHNCQDQHLAEAEVDVIRHYLDRPLYKRALDIGCGDSGAGQLIFEGNHYTGIDRLYGDDATALKFNDEGFDFVLLKRILCQHPPHTRAKIIAEAVRVCRPGGSIIICEPWSFEYAQLKALRIKAGLAPLPHPKSGGNLLTEGELNGHRLHKVADLPVASSYVYHTRFLHEMRTGNMLPYDAGYTRRRAPEEVSSVSRFNPYRVKVYERAT